MPTSLRQNTPKRNADIVVRAQYRDYKDDLRADFSQRCGYCDDHDRTFGNRRGFHIDHFAPKSLYPELTCVYSNLIYACPICNIAKSNKWYGLTADLPVNGDNGFIDPCSDVYDEHVVRTSEGAIMGKTNLGKSIVHDLKLGLLRHQLNWQLESIAALMDLLISISDRANALDITFDPKQVISTLRELNDLLKAIEVQRDA